LKEPDNLTPPAFRRRDEVNRKRREKYRMAKLR
jgi:hypothetical protein